VARRRLWALVAAVSLLVSLAFFGILVRAGSGYGPQNIILGLRVPWRGEQTLTATPTKTPAATLLATATPTPRIWLPSPTPTATNVVEAPPTPTAAVTTHTPLPPLPVELTSIAETFGIDPSHRFVIVDQNEQRMSVVDDDGWLRRMPVSTGDPEQNFHTPSWSGLVGKYWGSFSARGVWADNAWYLFELPGGGTILIHSAPYVMQDGEQIYQELDALGLYPASRGCIRLRPEDAEWFTSWQPEGVPIVILGWDST
jgi:lipoprotein-anchoring transpeptidase ErfK/SrfK